MLKRLAKAGGNNVVYVDAATAQPDKLFERIGLDVDIKIQRELTDIKGSLDNPELVFRNSVMPVLALKRLKYAVLFNIDVSESMGKDGSWDKVCECVSQFKRSLSREDIVCTLVFNDKVKFLRDLTPNDDLFVRREPEPCC